MMNKIVAAGALVCALTPCANADVIDFDDLAPGTIVDSEYDTLVDISVVNRGGGPDLGVVFDTSTTMPTGGDLDLVGPFDTNNPLLTNGFVADNVLIIQEHSYSCDTVSCSNPDDEGSRPAGTFTFDFKTVIKLESIDFFDVETAENGKTDNNAIRLFDVDNNEIMPGSFFTPDTGGDNMWDQVVFNVDGVKRIELNLGGSGAIDNITFTVVPVPAAVWLFSSGLIGLFALARRKA
jgi:hypothetical protein